MPRFRLFVTLFSLLALLMPLSAQHAVRQKMSPLVRARTLQPRTPLLAFVKAEGDISELYTATACDVYATFGDIQIVRIPQESLYALASDDRVQRIEMGRINSTTNAATAVIINSTDVHEGLALPQAYTGKGVVMGIQDIGFDLTNPNFYSRDMSTYRIQALWDMLATDSDDSSSLPVGAEYRGETELLQHEHSCDGLIACHGSHTLGTAAGSGYDSPYAGVAYDSDICLVCNIASENRELVADTYDDDFGSALTALGFKYIFDYADSVGKPCVISFSEGTYQGFEEDDILYFDVLDQLVGPGHILVASAGNNSQNAGYVHKPQGQERAGTFMRKYESQLYFQAQGTDDFTARLTIYGDQTEIIDIETLPLRALPDSILCDTIHVGDREYLFTYTAYPSCYDESNIVVECLIDGPHRIGYDDIGPISLEVLGESADVEVYSLIGYFVSNALDPSLSDAETSHNVFSPSAAPAVISVGATAYVTGYVNIYGDTMTYNYGEDGTRANFSSIGPTLDNRIKPDVMAPGTNIISSTNSFFFAANPDDSQWTDLVEAYEYDGRTYYWKTDTGTSMSAPFVGGAIALWLEAKPDLTREEIIDIFADTCTHPDAAMTYPNNFYGYGQIDVYRGLLRLLDLDKIENISLTQPLDVHFSVGENHSINITFPTPLTHPAEIRVYSISGQLLHTTSAAVGSTTITIPLAASANTVVAVQVKGDSPRTTGSTLLRI